MKIKLCFNDEIHRISSVPISLDALIKLIPTIFHSQLPDSWALQYKDCDGDLIIISDEKDFEEFKNVEHGGANAIAKIFIVSVESFKAGQPVNDTNMIMQDLKREEDYQVIEDEENKPEEVIKIKEEVQEEVPVKEPEVAPEEGELPGKEEIAEKQEEPEGPVEEEEPEKAEEKAEDEVRAAEQEEETERKEEVEENVMEEKELSQWSEKEEETEFLEEKEEPKVQEIVDYSKILGVPKEVMETQKLVEEVMDIEREPKFEDGMDYSKIVGPPMEAKEEVPEQKVEEPVEEKPDVDREEEKEQKEHSSMEFSKIEAVSKDKANDLSGMLDSKISMDVLQTLVASMIDKKLPEIAQYTQNQIEESRSSLNQSMFERSMFLNDDLPKKPAAPKVVHYQTKCAGCGMSPIVGIRYKCTVCHNFDYCEQCEDAGTHPHNFIKIRQRDVLDIFKPPQSKPVIFPAKPLLPEIFPKKPEVDPKEKEKQDAKFYDNLMEKAKKLQKCFPKEDFDLLCIYISDAPVDLSFEELVENYKCGKN